MYRWSRTLLANVRLYAIGIIDIYLEPNIARCTSVPPVVLRRLAMWRAQMGLKRAAELPELGKLALRPKVPELIIS